MIKKLFTTGILFFATHSVAAPSMLCTITPLTAARSGVVASEGDLKMVSRVYPNFQTSKEGCGTLKVLNSTVSLCAFEGEILGGYQVMLDVSPYGTPKGIFTSTSTKMFGSSKDRKELIEIWGNQMILLDVRTKVEHSRIQLPGLTQDLIHAVSASIGKAVRAGSVKPGELVAVILEDCSLVP